MIQRHSSILVDRRALDLWSLLFPNRTLSLSLIIIQGSCPLWSSCPCMTLLIRGLLSKEIYLKISLNWMRLRFLQTSHLAKIWCFLMSETFILFFSIYFQIRLNDVSGTQTQRTGAWFVTACFVCFVLPSAMMVLCLSQSLQWCTCVDLSPESGSLIPKDKLSPGLIVGEEKGKSNLSERLY